MARILRLTHYLDHNLGDEVTVNALAAQACYSPYHFERVFGDAVGTTPMDYVRQRRLQRVALRVRYENRTSLLQLAQECGFASNASFSRSFRNYFGCSPTDWRHGAWRDVMAQNLQHVRALEAADPSPEMQAYVDFWMGLRAQHWDVGPRVRVAHLAAQSIWSCRTFGLWGPAQERFCDTLLGNVFRSGAVPEDSWCCGVFSEDNAFIAPENAVGDIGVLAQGLPPPSLVAQTLPGGMYAVLETHNEPVTMQWMHEDWLEKQQYWTADMSRPYIALWRFTLAGIESRMLLPVRPA
ncbi:AraC family transcriptional regulator [Chitinilyticum litopenaei]|uniref:AraC family transcriptional regulator n=2 Tax=Chitinilyticum piscinae TaxID=2866724 RepID=A0A8J7FPN8_9NEIS|nr:AraC family transcriptional regulator [Chitinilyticum piscinae]